MRTNDNFTWRPQRSLKSGSGTWIVATVAFAGLGFWLGRSVTEADKVIVAEAPGIPVTQELEAEPAQAESSTVAESPAKLTPSRHEQSQSLRSPPVILLSGAPPSKDGSTIGTGGGRDSQDPEESREKRSAVNYKALRAQMLEGR